MIHCYTAETGALTPCPNDLDGLRKAVWIDLVSPTREEEQLVEQAKGIEVPTREEMREIEPSSRLYVDDGNRFLTAVLLVRSDHATPKVTAVTFILTGETLITVRYDDPVSFALFCSRAAKGDPIPNIGDAIFQSLLDTIIDRLADILEKIGDDVDRVSHSIFAASVNDHARYYRDDMRSVGRLADLISKARESLVSLARLLLFATSEVEGVRPLRTPAADLRSMQHDVEALSLHADYLTSKAQLLLDAIVGMVSIEQNNIIKIFAVLSVVLMPPTLVASIYGMNFKLMPELEWPWGYPAALLVMAMAGALPYLYFKWKRWL